MTKLDALLEDLVIANRILAHEGVVDGFGHVTVRHPERPDRFFMSRSRSPELVTPTISWSSISTAIRSISAAASCMANGLFTAPFSRPGPMWGSVVHNHAHEVIPYSVTKEPMRQIIHTAGGMGHRDVPVGTSTTTSAIPICWSATCSRAKPREDPRRHGCGADAWPWLYGHRQDHS